MELRTGPPTTPGMTYLTYEDLIRHYKKFGLDNSHTGYRHAAQTYGGYKKLAKDALVEVAFDYLNQQEYIKLITAIGYGEYADDAYEDWERGHDGN